jgi:pyruvate dehydrogenase E2 component (dihydrolipoamide acetyltransferase)
VSFNTQFNASLDHEELVLRRYCSIGVATDTPAGLLVPVLRDVDSKGVSDLAAEMAALSELARNRALAPAQMAGGTFTASSLGAIGGFAFTPIINAPEVAIPGVTRAATMPVWTGREFVPRLKLPLSLSYDHRVIDGADAARFTVRLAELLGDVLPSALHTYLLPAHRAVCLGAGTDGSLSPAIC